MAEVKKKIKSRSGHKLFVSNLIKEVDTLVQNEGDEVLPKLESIKCMLQEQRTEIKSLDSAIEELLEEDLLEKEIYDRCIFDSSLHETIFRIEARLKVKATGDFTAENVSVSSNNSNVSGSETSGDGSTVSAKSCKAKLPKLSLPTFSGDPVAWTTFSESFSSAIHQNADLSDIEKFQYLQSLLQKSAADTIRGLPLTGVNYKEAVDLLQSRYSNKQVIVSSHMETLLQLPKVNTSEELKKLRLVFDKTESVIRSLQGIGITPEMYGTFLTPILMSKISNDLRLILSRKLSDQKPRIQPATASALHTNYVGQQQGRGVRCIYFSNYHLSASCTTVTDPAARRKILRQKARCFLCLKGGHLSRDCPSQSRCFRCNQRHRVSICQSLQQPKPSLDKLQDVNRHPQSVQSSASARHSVPNSESYGEKVTTGLYLARPHNVSSCTLLQTARATICSPLNDVSCQARTLFDLGSQKSYVSRALKNQLGLIPIRTDKILLKTFGSNEPILKTCEVVQISIQCQDELKIFIQAYVVTLSVVQFLTNSLRWPAQITPTYGVFL